ncbi:MAG: molybdopterin molybdotransferase MoeA [Defluviicoccus sp.]|nr:molybdopterin molybdotransferase MoeA [Defluviicoccus sp.]MDG4591933.1 molybdopterin molybdotransferase MoeA [Defluviicoccus sp.]MDS4071788.1 molybdopterin molybdotransferase MoeA [Defluviicoccus sp.]
MPENRSPADAPVMTLAEALAALAGSVRPIADHEPVPLAHALDRILAEEVRAGHAVPPHDNAAVDGYAFAAADLAQQTDRRLRVVDRAAAGHPITAPPPPGTAVRIFTGAPMPPALDTVAMQEDCRLEEGHVLLPAGLKAGANRRRAGEDVREGAVVLKPGRRLRAQDIGLAAAVGVGSVRVYRRLRAAVFSTGDELKEPGTPLEAGEIHDANRYALMALLSGLGCTVADLGIIADRERAIRAALAQAAGGHDLIVTSGGMSVGEEDHVKAAVRELGSLAFWRLAIKPGRPIGIGAVSGVPFIGLPGNPVAMIVTFLRIARPLVLGLAGATETAPTAWRVRAGFAARKKTGRREWVRARLVAGAGGEPVAQQFPQQGSGILSSLVEADGLIELPEDLEQVSEGDRVDFYPFSAFR